MLSPPNRVETTFLFSFQVATTAASRPPERSRLSPTLDSSIDDLSATNHATATFPADTAAVATSRVGETRYGPSDVLTSGRLNAQNSPS